jgi:anti-anti-sigma factor
MGRVSPASWKGMQSPCRSVGLVLPDPCFGKVPGLPSDNSPLLHLPLTPEDVMKLNSRKHNDVLILYPEGKVTLGDGDQELGEAVRTSLVNGERKIVINFSKVSYLDSSGVGELVGCYTSIKGKGGELRICGMNSKIFSLIKMTSLHSVFEVKDTEEEALAGF